MWMKSYSRMSRIRGNVVVGQWARRKCSKTAVAGCERETKSLPRKTGCTHKQSHSCYKAFLDCEKKKGRSWIRPTVERREEMTCLTGPCFLLLTCLITSFTLLSKCCKNLFDSWIMSRCDHFNFASEYISSCPYSSAENGTYSWRRKKRGRERAVRCVSRCSNGNKKDGRRTEAVGQERSETEREVKTKFSPSSHLLFPSSCSFSLPAVDLKKHLEEHLCLSPSLAPSCCMYAFDR